MKIILLTGWPASGKTTYAQSYCRANPNTIHINADKMRLIVAGDESNMKLDGVVWATLERMAEYLLISGYSLVIDNLNKNKKARKQWIKLAKQYLCSIECHKMLTPYGVCIERNSRRERKVPHFVYEKFATDFEEPALEEGFDKIVNIEYELNS